MYARPTVSVDEGLEIVARARRDADERFGEAVAVAVVGAGGELVAFAADDALGPLPRLVAVRKAYTAALLRRSTREAAVSVASGTLDLARLGEAQLLTTVGGVCVVDGDTVRGGVGVSGLAADDDESVALRAL